jgi:hypothetical protein
MESQSGLGIRVSRSQENRYRRETDPFTYTKEVGDKLAMADIEGRRKPHHDHDHLPFTFDPEPWRDDENQIRKPARRGHIKRARFG